MDRTNFTTFDNRTNPMFIVGVTNASNHDTFNLPEPCSRVLLTSVNDTDAIVSVGLTSNTLVTVSAVDDDGADIATDLNINFVALRK